MAYENPTAAGKHMKRELEASTGVRLCTPALLEHLPKPKLDSLSSTTGNHGAVVGWRGVKGGVFILPPSYPYLTLMLHLSH